MNRVIVILLIGILALHGNPMFSQQRDSTINVFADVMAEDTWCQVTWSPPFYSWEMIFDDGEADDYALWQLPGSISAVKFTPTFYPAYIAGGRMYVGDGSFPGPFLGTSFRVEIYDDDGSDGLPGTLLDSVTVVIDNYGWVLFDLPTPFCGIEQGSFYLGMVQTVPAPDAAPIGVDTDNPTYSLSYSCFQGSWNVSPYQDFMMRASVTGDSVPEPVVDEYEVARFSNFDPDGSPLDGDTTVLDTTLHYHHNDHDWAGLPQGYYAFGVRSHYASGEWSDYFVSNVVGHLMTFSTYISVIVCDTTHDAFVTVEGPGYYEEFILPANGAILLENIVQGDYHITIYCPGNYTYDDWLWIQPGITHDLVLSCWLFPVDNLNFEGSSEMAYWDVPKVMKLKADFEAEPFPPAGWQSESLGYGWFRTDDGSGGGWIIPSWDSPYACANDLINGPGNNGSMDYLVTPQMLLDYRDDYALHFDGYYDGTDGETATIEYSHNYGQNWNYLYTIQASDDWEHFVVDLSPFSGNGNEPVMLAFHADDSGQEASGWAVDNVVVFSPEPPVTLLDYYVFIDDSLVVVTDTNMAYLDGLVQGESYELCVAARYPSGLSARECLSFLYTGEKELHAIQQLIVFPNPAKDHVQVRSDRIIKALRLYDATGRVVEEIFPGSLSWVLDVSELPDGLCFVHIQTEGGNFSKKLMIFH